MKVHFSLCVAGAVVMWAPCAPLRATEMESAKRAPMPSLTATKRATSMCAKADDIVFSCPLARTGSAGAAIGVVDV